MSNKLLGVAGFTADKVAKSFSVNKYGHVNVVGDVKGAIIGNIVEPYGPNYSGVVAVMGRQVLAGVEIDSLAPGCRYLGSSGNRLFFQNSVNSKDLTITNLNLQVIGTHTIPEVIVPDSSYRGEMFVKDGYFVYSTANEIIVKTDRFEEVLRLGRYYSPVYSYYDTVLIHNNMVIKTESKRADNPNPKLSFYELPTGKLVKTIDIVDVIVKPITNGVIGLFNTFITAEGDKLVLAVRTSSGQEDVARTINVLDLNNYSVIVAGAQPLNGADVDSFGIHDGTLYMVPFNSAKIGLLHYMDINKPTNKGLIGQVFLNSTGTGTAPADARIVDGILSVRETGNSKAPNRMLYKNKMQEIAPGASLYNWSAGKDRLGRIVMCKGNYVMILSEELILKGYRVVES